MKQSRNPHSNISYISAFVIGVLLFATFRRPLFGFTSTSILIAGIAGVAVAVIVFWLWNEIKRSKDSDN